jgi:hypothetical protein
VNRLEELLNKLISGEPLEDWKSLNRLEQYLICILTRTGMEELGEPMNRLEVLLQALYMVVPDNAVEIISARIDPDDSILDVLSARLEEHRD